MRVLARFLVGLAAAIGGLAGAQLPEFAQQYRQRLGGAWEELHRIVTEFDAGAARNGLSRDEALDTYSSADEPFLREQGASVESTMERYANLSEQRERLAEAPPIMRPIVVLSGPDPQVARGAWADFEPAVPTTPAGFVWAAVGFFVLGGLVSLVRQLVGIARRRRLRQRAAH